MDIEVRVADLKDVLAEHKRVVERSQIMPVYGHLLLRSEGSGQLEVSSANGRLSLSTTCTADVDAAGSLLLPIDGIGKVIRSLKGSVRISAGESYAAAIESGRTRVRLVGLDPTTFPGMLRIDESASASLPTHVVAEAFGQVSYACSTEVARSNLNGVSVRAKGRTLSIAATDGHRLALVERQLDEEVSLPGGAGGVIVPTDAARFIASLMGGAAPPDDPPVDLEEADDDVVAEVEARRREPAAGTLVVTEARIVASAPGVEFRSQLLSDLFPDYAQVVPTRWRLSFRIGRSDLLGLVKRSSSLAERGQGMTWQLEAGSLKSVSRSSTFGDVTDWLDVAYDGEPMKIGLDYRYVADALSNLQGDEVECRMIDQLAPIMFVCPIDPALRAIVMPMRV